MGPIYLIDAYNLIFSDTGSFPGPFEAQRKKLLALLESPALQGSSQIFAVFDGKPGRWSPISKNPIQVVFTQNRDADTWIKEKVDAMKRPSNAIVVTNDKAIQIWVRGARAKVIRCEAFLSLIQDKPEKKRRDDLTPSEKRAITSEYARLWMKKKN